MFVETFHMNPRLCVSLQETGDVVMALNQHTAMDPKVIGFTGYPLTPSGKHNCFGYIIFNQGTRFYASHFPSVVHRQFYEVGQH